MFVYVTMSNFKVHPKKLSLSFDISSSDLSPFFLQFIQTPTSSFTYFLSHFLSSALLFLFLLFLCHLMLSALSVNHHAMYYSHNHLLVSAIKSCYFMFLFLTVHYSIEDCSTSIVKGFLKRKVSETTSLFKYFSDLAQLNV